MGGYRLQSTSSQAPEVGRKPWTLHARHAPTGLSEGLTRVVAGLWLTEAHTSPRLLSVMWASRAAPMSGGRSAGYLDGILRAGRTPGSLEEGGSRDGATLQRTRSTLGTLREINAYDLPHPLGYSQGLPRRGRRDVVQELTALR
jgi:hypothetical protein